MDWLTRNRTDSKDAAVRRKAVRAFLAVLICLVIILGAVGVFIGAFVVERQKKAATQDLIRQLELAAKRFESDWQAHPSSRNPSMLRGSQNLSFWLCNEFDEFFANPDEPFRSTNVWAEFVPQRGPYLKLEDIERFGRIGDVQTINFKGRIYRYFTIHDRYGEEITFDRLSTSVEQDDWSLRNEKWYPGDLEPESSSSSEDK